MNDTPKTRTPRKNAHTKQKAVLMRKVMRQEIDELRVKVRAAYTLEAQINVCDYEATENELELISERPINTKILEKLESIYFHNKTTDNSPLFEFHLGRDTLIILHFFYLVRLAQQGFLYLISNAYPELEPEAVIYLCDKMVGASVYAERSNHKSDRVAFRKIAYHLMKNLVNDKDEPVAEGFKTTFKQINNVIQNLIFRATDPKEKNSENPNLAIIPPLWVVSPNINMLDSKTFAAPGAIPTLPYPASLLPVSNNNTFPCAADELKEHSIMLKEKHKAAKTELDAKKLAKKENDAKLLAEKESAAKELAEKQISGNVEEAEDDASEEESEEESEEDDEDDEEFSEHGYDDRFADAETSDESDEEQVSAQTFVHESPVKQVEVVKSNSEASISQAPSSPATSQASISHTNQAHETPVIPKANSSWLNFAAASPEVETTSGLTSPRDNNRGNKPYHINPRY